MPSNQKKTELEEEHTETEASEQMNSESEQIPEQKGAAIKSGNKKKIGKKTVKTQKSTNTGSKNGVNTNAKKVQTKSKGKKKNKEGERFFKLIDPKTGKSHGRYTGETPKQAASKGYTKLVQKLKAKKKPIPKQTTIYLRESTRNGNKKIYGYQASRIKLDEPQLLEIKDKITGKMKPITYHYRNKIKKVPVPDQIGGILVKNLIKKSQKSKTSKNTKSSSSSGKSAKSGSKSSKTTKDTKGGSGKTDENTKKTENVEKVDKTEKLEKTEKVEKQNVGSAKRTTGAKTPKKTVAASANKD